MRSRTCPHVGGRHQRGPADTVVSDLPVPMTPLLPLLLTGSVDSRTGSRSPTPLQSSNPGEQSFTG